MAEANQSARKKGAIAAGHPETAEAGRLILEAGGNAFDAAVAASLAACVVEPMLTSLGGGGFLLAHPAQGSPVLFDFFTQTPQQHPQQPDFYSVAVNFGDAVQHFHVGLGSVAVPGTLAGLLHVHHKLGRLPRSVVFEPAIALAKTGVRINRFQAYCIQILEPILTLSTAGKRAYQIDGTMLDIGDRLHLEHLADSLRHFAETGAESLYRGELAERIVRDSQAQGGTLTRADLEQYQVLERSPLQFGYRDRTLLTNPPPSSGGALIAFSLALLEGIDPSNLGEFGSAQHAQALLETMRLTNAARQQGYDEQLYDADVIQNFLGREHLQEWRSPLLSALCQSPPNSKLGSTTHISVIDAEGNAASVTASNGEGSGYFVPGSGIMLNNMLGEADLNPHGFHQWQPNQRLSSMMAPTLVLHKGQPEFALGSGGSNRIRTAILQVLCNLLDFGLPLADAIAAPRLHWEENVLNWEPGWSPSLLSNWINSSKMPQQPIPWSSQNMFFGGVHGVQKKADGQFTGAGDPRRDGAFAP